MYAQHKKHAIDWATVRRMTPGMILGVLLGAATAKYMPTLALQVFFIAFLAFIAVKTLRDSKPKPHNGVCDGFVRMSMDLTAAYCFKTNLLPEYTA